MKELYTIDQVAEILSLHPKTIRNYIKSGLLNAIKTGGQWRVRAAELSAYLNGGQTTEGGFPAGSSAPADSGPELYKESFPISGTQKSDSGNIDQTTPPPGTINVSTVIDMYVRDKTEAIRMANSIFAVMNSEAGNQTGSRCDHFYYPENRKARFILWGSPDFTANMLQLIRKLQEQF